jgi:hypothetical protein
MDSFDLGRVAAYHRFDDTYVIKFSPAGESIRSDVAATHMTEEIGSQSTPAGEQSLLATDPLEFPQLKEC